MKKFILFSILKTWLFSTFISIIFLYFYLDSIRTPANEYRHICDMSGLAYGLIIMWILFLSIISLTSLLSVKRIFKKTIFRFLCWFLFPFLFCITFFLAISEGKYDKENLILTFISCLPWFSFWGFYYYRFNKKLASHEDF